MRVAIIGRTEILFESIHLIQNAGHTISCILTSKEAPEYTKTAKDFERLALSLNIPYASTGKIESQLTMLESSQSDIAVSINYSGVIPEKITSLFPLGILNAHGGDLPRYRGNACQAWAIINGEDRIGLCIHRMIGGELDSGDIIEREFLPINLNTKVTEAWSWMADRVPQLFLNSINKLAENPDFVLEIQSKDKNAALRCYPRTPEDGRIDWSKTAIEILRLINASTKPYSGAFCFFENDKITIWEAELAPDENFIGVPGQIACIHDSYIDVLTGSGKLRILLVERGGKVLKPNQLSNSTRKRFV